MLSHYSDVIQDFETGKDLIDLSAIDADTTKEGHQSFTFSDNWYFTEAGQIIEFAGMLYVNTDNDNFANFVINMNGVTDIQATDFIL